MKLAERIAIVTGAGSGIGRAIALRFAAEGARVALVDLDEATVREAAAGIATGQALPFVADVTDGARAEAIVAEIGQVWGAPDVLVPAAAVAVGGTVTETTPEDWRRVFAVNVDAVYLWCRAVLPGMVATRRGAIVTIASQRAFSGGRNNASYVASKAAIVGLTRALAVDYAGHGIRINCLVPGAIQTPFFERSLARQPDPEGRHAPNPAAATRSAASASPRRSPRPRCGWRATRRRSPPAPCSRSTAAGWSADSATMGMQSPRDRCTVLA